MSDRYTRVFLARAGKGQTDWRKLASLDDIELAVRAIDDADTIIATPAELASFAPVMGQQARFGFRIHRTKAGDYRWSLLTADERALAVGPESYASKKEALEAVKSFLFALGNVDDLAA